MNNSTKTILNIGIDSSTSTIERLAKTFFNIDCLLAILSTIAFFCYCILQHQGLEISFIPLSVIIVFCIAIYFNAQGFYKEAIYLSTFFSYVIICISAFLFPSYLTPFYLIQLGVSIFIYFAHAQRKSFILFIFFIVSGILLFALSHTLIPDHTSLNIIPKNVFPVILFFGLFLYKISALIFIYQKIITIHNIKEKALEASENKFRIQFENTQLGIIVFDENLSVQNFNPSFCKMIGYTKEEMIELDIIKNCMENSPEMITKFQELKTAQVTRFKTQKIFTKKDGTPLITDAFISGIYDENKNFICSNCSFLDITTKVQTERVLENSKSKYRDIFENMHDSIIILDKEGNITEYNAAAKKLFELEDLKSLRIGDIVHPGDIKRSAKYFQKLRAEGYYTNFQGRIIIPGGKVKYIEVDSIAIKDEHGNFNGSRDITRDITDRKMTENALKQSESRYRTIFENAFDGLLVYDIDQKKWLGCNSKILDLFSTNEETILNNTANFFPEFQANGESTFNFFKNKISEIISNNSILYQCQLQDANGQLLHIEIASFRLPSPDENVIVSILKDVTEKTKQEAIIQDTLKELNQKNEDLQKYIESNMQLENFAYMASHDLKAPLRTITSYIQLISRRARHKFDKTELEFLDFIIGASKNMGKLIEALLAYSKVGSQENSFKFFGIETLIYSITQELQTDIEENNINIEIGKMPNIIFADPTRLRQLFQNLISNSIKFKSIDQPPLIKINCKETETDYHFSLEDNGIGIKEEFFDKIFSLFTKLHSSGEYEGTGIGLALCKKIVEQHEGKIWLESQFEKGTTFFFTISKSLSEEQNNPRAVKITSMMN